MTNGKVIFLLLLSLSMMVLFPKFSAAAEASCSGLSDSGDHSQLQQKDDSGICTVEISNKADNSAKPTFSYQWNSEGRVMSTVQSKNGTGERTYYIVPVESDLQVQGEPALGSQYQINASEQKWSVDKKTSSLVLPGTCQGTTAPATEKNKGGLSIKSCSGKLVIDSGWRMGVSPDRDRAGESVIHDPSGSTCTVLNRHIYNYAPGIAPSPKFVTARDWHDYLKTEKKCKNLNIDFLKGSSLSEPRLPANEKLKSAGEQHHD